ncbi:MAG: ABC-2 transporter permease [Clostridiales bacterium]|nr:ABC-2 transporter permease [Clostridiales bacterium]
MIGIMKKDFILIKKQLLVVIAMLIIHAVLMGSQATMDGFQAGSFCLYITAFMGILPVTILGYDERHDWGKYASAMPVTRKENVIAKFLIMLILTALALAIYMIFAVLMGIKNLGATLIMVGAVSIISSSLMLAISYKFGTSKAGVMFIGLLLIMLLVMFLLMDAEMAEQANSLSVEGAVFGEMGEVLVPMTVVLAVVIYIACMLVSIHIYSKKDF